MTTINEESNKNGGRKVGEGETKERDGGRERDEGIGGRGGGTESCAFVTLPN